MSLGMEMETPPLLESFAEEGNTGIQLRPAGRAPPNVGIVARSQGRKEGSPNSGKHPKITSSSLYLSSPWRVKHFDLDLGLRRALGVLGRHAVDSGVVAPHFGEDGDAVDDGNALVGSDVALPSLLRLLRPRVLDHAGVRLGSEVERGRSALLELVRKVSRLELRLIWNE